MNAVYYCYLSSPVGRLTLASDGINITGLWLEGQKYYASTLAPDAVEVTLPVFEQTKLWLELYFDRQLPNLFLPLAPQGSDFRQAVWRKLCAIPYGTLVTYGEIAKQLAFESHQEKASARAVGNAVGHNPISILIPCHRVIGADGSLTGYAGGINKKRLLLALEGVPLSAT